MSASGPMSSVNVRRSMRMHVVSVSAVTVAERFSSAAEKRDDGADHAVALVQETRQGRRALREGEDVWQGAARVLVEESYYRGSLDNIAVVVLGIARVAACEGRAPASTS